MQSKIIRKIMVIVAFCMIPVAMIYLGFVYARDYIHMEIKGEI